MEKCWDGNPSNRPSAAKIYEIFTEWENDSKILLELTESNKILKNTENTHVQTYPEAVYKSSFISYIESDYQGNICFLCRTTNFIFINIILYFIDSHLHSLVVKQ
jgi:hypothetical protein